MAFPPSYHFVGSLNEGKLGPAELLRDPFTGRKGWYQSGIQRQKVKKHYHLVWPKDKDRGQFGRMKDILQGKGPDIYLTVGAQKGDYAHNRPLHGRWSNWQALDPRSATWPGQNTLSGPCWVRNGMLFGRDASKKYNFYTRKYEDFHPNMWTDAIWQGPHKNSNCWPDQWREVNGGWREDDNWDPRAPGQRMENI